jgi:hypothetical protein
MTLADLKTRWEARRNEYARFDVYVAGAKLIDEWLGELDQLAADERDAVLTLAEAAAASGYSADHLGRLVRAGRLVNIGRAGAPRVRRGDLPRKGEPCSSEQIHDACASQATRVLSPSQIARSLVTEHRRTR